jgi:hypothetical protein
MFVFAAIPPLAAICRPRLAFVFSGCGLAAFPPNITKNLCRYFAAWNLPSAPQQIVNDNLFNTTGNIVEFPGTTLMAP